VTIVARALSWTVAHAPFLWPLLRKPTRKFWDRAAGVWDTGRAADAERRTAPLMAAVAAVEPPARILELGTGTGAGALALAERFPGADITAVDLSPEMIDQATRKLTDALHDRVRFERGDAAKLPYPDGSFDLVCQLNLPLYATEIARVVRPGGSVVIAHTLGPRTPYYTPDAVLRRKFGRLGFEETALGEAGEGTYFVARRPAGAR
jgi:ubiquinone/menaquinone biosynthesis C-methylase UbiE